MQRRTALKQLGQWAGAAALAGCGGGGGSSPGPGPDARPNILMIAIDDLNDWVGFLKGHPQVRTPGLDALAARSTVFERAYCNAPTCTGSRASALTGLSVQSTGVWDLDHTFRVMHPGTPMLEDMLAGAGYARRVIGKVDHVFNLGDQPLPSSFPYANQQCANASTMGVGAFDWGPVDGPDAAHPDYRFAQQAIDFLAEPAGSPFFLAVGFVRTHVGWYVPRRFFDQYPKSNLAIPNPPADDLDDLGPAGKALALKFGFHDCIARQNLWADAVQAYLASISWVDTQVARVIAALDASAHAANTVVVLWSDHGFHLGEKFHWHKQALWERSTRVPFLIRSPGQGAGVRESACVSLRDMAPTLLDFAGVAPAYPMDGRSLRPLLAAPGSAWDHPVLTTHQQYDHAIRTANWRYIRYRSNEQELYDVRTDPDEYRNLARDPAHAAVMAELDALMPPRVA